MQTCREEGKNVVMYGKLLDDHWIIRKKKTALVVPPNTLIFWCIIFTHDFYIYKPSICSFIYWSHLGFWCYSFIEFSQKCLTLHSIRYPQLSRIPEELSLSWPYPGLPLYPCWIPNDPPTPTISFNYCSVAEATESCWV